MELLGGIYPQDNFDYGRERTPSHPCHFVATPLYWFGDRVRFGVKQPTVSLDFLDFVEVPSGWEVTPHVSLDENAMRAVLLSVDIIRGIVQAVREFRHRDPDASLRFAPDWAELDPAIQ